jgi:His-Xaa-Ser system radical SAM maturase HxsC
MVTAEDAGSVRHGDILQVQPNGKAIVVWGGKETKGNAFFVTSACNCRCVMCPQPPAEHSRIQLETNKEILQLLSDDVLEICLTGGEPTLLKEEFLDLLASCTRRFPRVPLAVLSNGIRLADLEVAKEIARVRNRFITFCIPLYSDIDDIHDEITGVQDSFYRTIRGIQNLALLRIPIEIRHVIMQRNCDRLVNFAEFVYRNFPFVVHVAYMGCEMTGLARTNADRVWIDPSDYASNLEEAVRSLERRGVRVSVYNHQLCLLSGAAKRNARKAISDWKEVYLPECAACMLRNDCGGFFGTSGNYISKNISPVLQ